MQSEMKRMIEVRRALLSVSDKKGLVEFARGLASMGVEIISTGGTARTLREASLKVQEVAELTGFPEMLDGRVKTLHPFIHGGILARRELPEHMAQLKAHNIKPIDMVVVNLYPFEATIEKPGCSEQEAIEHIDIGGPCLIRAAAKNHTGVAVVVDPQDYEPLLGEIREHGGKISLSTSRALAQKAFELTSRYDALIARWLGKSACGAS